MVIYISTSLSSLIDIRSRGDEGEEDDDEWDDIQLGWFDPDISLLGLVDNVGEASSIGFEIDSKIILSDRVSATFAFAKNDAVLTEDYELRGAIEAKKDQDLPFTPDKKGNFGLTAEISDKSRIDFNYAFVDKMWNDLFYDDREMQDSYGIGSLSYTMDVSDQASIQVYFDNVFDEVAELYINSEDIEKLTTVNRPRTFGIKYSWKMNK